MLAVSDDPCSRLSLDAFDIGILIASADGDAILDANARLCDMFGYMRHDLLGLNPARLLGLDHLRDDAGQAVETAPRVERRCVARDGREFFCEVSARRLESRGEPVLVVTACDITERKRATETIRLQADQYSTMISTTPDAFFTFDRSGAICTHNRVFCRMTGYPREACAGLTVADIEAAETAEDIEQHLAMIARTGCDRYQSRLRRRDGVLLDVEISVSFWDGRQARYLCFIRDITDRLRAERQIARMASYDMLTGLANRRHFVAILEQTIARGRRSGRRFAVLYLDLDHFKDVNDTLGHPAGDELLKTVSQRLQASVRAGDTVARFGGDEFAIILDDIGKPDEAAAVSERLLGVLAGQGEMQAGAAMVAAGVAGRIVEAMTEPVFIEANRVYSGASVGLVVYGADAPDAETILSNADLALYKAKAERRGSFRFFTSEMDAQFRARVSMSAELRDAIAHREFCLDYQPQVDLQTGRIAGVEALVRWQHPKVGKIGPGKFIEQAESNGLIVPLGRWVIEEACRQSKAWLDAGLPAVPMAVNLSGVQFKAPLELEQDITSIVARSGLSPELVELELTESVLMDASRDHNDVLLRLRQRGFRLAIDDFGTGYSSLDYLRRYPVDRIKIAQTFIADLGVQPGNDAIVRAALSLARELGIEVVVEGVETAAQVALLKAWRARIVQGYFFARPMPGGEMGEVLRAGRVGV